jgi:hypothetical protein
MEFVENGFAFDGVDEHGGIERVVKVDEGSKPVSRDEAGVAGDKERAEVGVADFEIIEVDFDGRGGDDIADGDEAFGEEISRGAGGLSGLCWDGDAGVGGGGSLGTCRSRAGGGSGLLFGEWEVHDRNIVKLRNKRT